MTPARAARIRAERVEGKRFSRKEIKEARREKNGLGEQMDNRPSMERV